jgi:hypothetical protein
MLGCGLDGRKQGFSWMVRLCRTGSAHRKLELRSSKISKKLRAKHGHDTPPTLLSSPMRNRQLFLFKEMQKKQFAFGGSQLKSNPKEKRYISTREAMHLVLRSDRAKGAHSFLRRSKHARELIYKISEKYGVRIYKFANVGNHFHIVLRIYKRFLWKAFICELTSRLAALVGLNGKLWKGRPFTRVIAGWGRNFKNALGYVSLNQLEAAGVITRDEKLAFNSA